MPIRPDKRSDCSRCVALCCIAYPAERSPGFAATKAAGEPCPNLDSCGQCRIYDRRTEAGFSGCLEFECFGAGQYVVQQLFGGRDWRDDPALLAPMLDSFHIVRKACDLLYLVDYAREHASAETLDRIEAELVAIASSSDVTGKTVRLCVCETELKRLFESFAPAP